MYHFFELEVAMGARQGQEPRYPVRITLEGGATFRGSLELDHALAAEWGPLAASWTSSARCS